MNKYKVILSAKAFTDIEDIFEYIALEKLAPENARNQTDRIYKALKNLELFPHSCQDRISGYFAVKGYKQLLIDNYIVIFKIDNERKIVKIVTVQYHGRNV